MSMPTQDEAIKWAMMEDEVERLRASLKEIAEHGYRAATIEECARVAEATGDMRGLDIATAIRALKDKP